MPVPWAVSQLACYQELLATIKGTNLTQKSYSDPQQLAKIQFPFLGYHYPVRFSLDHQGFFPYMGHEMFAKLHRELQALAMEWKCYEHYLYRTMG
jgi:hypothetical protein